MAELVDDREPDLLPDFRLGRAHSLDVLLVEDNVIHLLLVVALVVLIFNLVTGRRGTL